jgi:cell division initiation protein
LVPAGGDLKLTPIEIRKQEFKKGMRGYDTVEIDTFLELVANEYENLIKENEHLNKQIVSLETELKHFKENEKTLKQTLYKVQETSQLSKENSEREANIIKKEADLHAAQITEKARAEVHRMREEFLALKQQKDSFVARLRHLLESQIELMEVLSVDDEELSKLKSRSKKSNLTKRPQTTEIVKEESKNESPKQSKTDDQVNEKPVEQPDEAQPESGKKPGRDFFKDIFSDNLDVDVDDL